MNFDQCADVSGERISPRLQPVELDSKDTATTLQRKSEVHHANGQKGAKKPGPGVMGI